MVTFYDIVCIKYDSTCHACDQTYAITGVVYATYISFFHTNTTTTTTTATTAKINVVCYKFNMDVM